jgi:hypothetical protein
MRGVSADELKDFWSPVLDGPERDALLAEANAALGAPRTR